MDFSAIADALSAVQAEKNVASTVTPIKISEDRPNLNVQQLMSEAQKRKRENEMSHRSKAKRNKKMERSKGYLEKMEIKDKEKKKKDKKVPKNKKDKNQKKSRKQ